MGGQSAHKRSVIYIAIILVVAMGAGLTVWYVARNTILNGVQSVESTSQLPTKSTVTPRLDVKTVITGREHVWDISFLPSGELMFTERNGTLSLMSSDGAIRKVAQITDVHAKGEGGLMGLAVDPQFTENRYIFTCFNTKSDVRVVRWKVNTAQDKLEDRKDIITGMPTSGGRHSGCRVAFAPDGYLWVATGDAALGGTAQDPKSLGGKILRVDRDGKAAKEGNMPQPFDARVFSYGHRNTQGMAFFPVARAGVIGFSAEHGPTTDDEVNFLKPGNFGWAATPPYNENVPMTDKTKFPDAVDALWSSGAPAQAPSGLEIILGPQWKSWDGAVAVAMLRAKHLKILVLDEKNKVISEEQIVKGEFGRLRAVTQGPDGNVYIGTDNGSGNDVIIKITPS